MSWFLLILKIVLGLVVVGVVAVGLLYYSANKSAQAKSRMIDELAQIPVGSTVVETVDYAEKLGFNFSGSEFAIPHVAEMKNEDEQRSSDSLPVKVDKQTDLSNFKNGTLNFGLSLFLFSRKGCEIRFKDGRVQSTRIWALD